MNRYLWEKRLRGCMAVLTLREHSVLMMLATYADSSGRGARPAMSSLADDCGTHRDTVKRTLKSLVAKGYLTVDGDRLGGRNRPTRYDLVWSMPHCQEGDLDEESTGISDDKGGRPSAPLSGDKGGQSSAPLSGSIPSERGANAPPKGVQSSAPRSGKKPGKDKTPTAVDDVRNCRQGDRKQPSSSTTFSDGVPIPEPPPTVDDRDRLAPRPDDPATVTIDATQPVPAEPSSAARTVVRQELGTAGYPRRTIDRLAVQVDRLARQGIPDDVTREALREWDRRPGAPRPEWLETIASDVVAARRARAAPDQPVRPSKLRGIAELAAAERAKEHAQYRKELR